MPDDKVPLGFYRAYRKAIRDIRTALDASSEHMKHCGMNNVKGVVAVLDVVLQDIEPLMNTASLTGYEVPEPYLGKFRRWQQKQKEKYDKKHGLIDEEV